MSDAAVEYGRIWRALAETAPVEELPKGLDAIWHSAHGHLNRWLGRRAKLLARAGAIVARQHEIESRTDESLREEIAAIRWLFLRGRETPYDVDWAFVLIREAVFRACGKRPHLVQIAGGLGLESGCIVEMATGEGKTLTATIPAIVSGWRSRGCHVLTVNDYLARRDAEEMAPIYHWCGLTVDCVYQDLEPEARRNAYAADVTYSTNKDVAADYLRDRLTLGTIRTLSGALIAESTLPGGNLSGKLVMRGLESVIVDEADSVLIDEAVTPLIISGEGGDLEQEQSFSEASALAQRLQEERDYRINLRYREISITSTGKKRLEQLTKEMGGLWRGARRREELVNQALVAKHLFLRDTHYIVDEEKVVIIDESTGRLMPDRTWRDGLHQAIEAKEGVPVNAPKATCARISFQRFFRFYRRISGMTGTGAEAQSEFWKIYNLPFVPIPTHRPCKRVMKPCRVFLTQAAKTDAIVGEVARIHATGQPVLIGTRSVQSSQDLHERLERLGLPHQVLNAIYHKEEAEIVAAAGHIGAITVATNMAGRGTDIRLGKGVAELGGLHVIATERQDTSRIDRQLYGRSSRQGDPGSAQAFVSMEDDLIRKYAGSMARLARRFLRDRDGEISASWARKLFDMAEFRACRMALRQRKGVVDSDNWLDEMLGFAGREA